MEHQKHKWGHTPENKQTKKADSSFLKQPAAAGRSRVGVEPASCQLLHAKALPTWICACLPLAVTAAPKSVNAIPSMDQHSTTLKNSEKDTNQSVVVGEYMRLLLQPIYAR